MSGGSKFHAAGPACEKVRSSNLVRGRGVMYSLLAAQYKYVLLRCWRTDDVFEIRHTSASVYSVHDRTQFQVDTTADEQPVQHHHAWHDMLINIQLMDDRDRLNVGL